MAYRPYAHLTKFTSTSCHLNPRALHLLDRNAAKLEDAVPQEK